MTHTPAWRTFKRMQGSACLFASLVYTGAAVHGWRVLPGSNGLKSLVMFAFPGFYFLASLGLPLLIPPVRRWLKRYVWLSFASGFGQTPISILVGLGLLGLAAAFIYLQTAGVAHGGRYPAGVFSGYAAGIGILFAQALLVRTLERDPEVRSVIEN